MIISNVWMINASFTRDLRDDNGWNQENSDILSVPARSGGEELYQDSLWWKLTGSEGKVRSSSGSERYLRKYLVKSDLIIR